MEQLKLNSKEKELLGSKGISYNYDSMSDDDLVELEEQMGELLVYEGVNEDGSDNKKGALYRNIIMKLVALD